MFELLDEEFSSTSPAPLDDDLFAAPPPRRTPRRAPSRAATSTSDIPRLIVFPGAGVRDNTPPPLPPRTLKQARADIGQTLFEAFRCFWSIEGGAPILIAGLLTFAWLCSEPPGVLNGVKVNGQNMGGLSQSELRDSITKLAQKKANTPVTLVFGAPDGTATEQRLTVKPRELAIWEKAPLPTAPYTNVSEVVARAYLYGRELSLIERFEARQPYRSRTRSQFQIRPSIDEDRLKRRLNTLKKRPVNASMVWTGTRAVTKKEVYGLEVDPATAAKQIESGLANDQTTIQVSARPVAPRIVTADLVELTSQTMAIVTITSPDPSALNNAEVAVRVLGSLTIMPGETISLNKELGERKAEKGYKKAATFVNGKTVRDLGGGICYPATSVFQAARKTRALSIIERHGHSKAVLYAEKGDDAALAWGFKDVKLKNTSKKPVVLMVEVEGKRVIARILSAPVG